jgi:alpha-beta hydrolase superfamily lysophospholipase
VTGRGFSPDLPSTATVDLGTTRDGLTQVRRRWTAADAHTVVVIVHGLGEHSGRYEHVARQLVEAGITTVGYDHRGFGESAGVRGHVDRFSQFLDDLEDQLAEVRALGLPTVVLGHSLGGLVAASYAVSGRPRPDRLVLSAPLLDVDASALVRSVTALVSRLAPTSAVTPPFGIDELATDPRVGAHYAADPLVVRRMTARLAAEVVAEVARVRARHDRLAIPTLVLHGADDTMVKPAASEAFGSLPTVERRIFPGLRHEILNEPAGPAIVDEIVARIGPPPTRRRGSGASQSR